MDTISTLTKLFRVFGCLGSEFHIFSGIVLLKAVKGYVCPYCGAQVKDMTDTPIGREYFAWLRPDLWRRDHSPTRTMNTR
jgi:hypothetical protein